MKNYIYQISNEKDYIRIYSKKLMTTYVSVYKEKGNWEVVHKYCITKIAEEFLLEIERIKK